MPCTPRWFVLAVVLAARVILAQSVAAPAGPDSNPTPAANPPVAPSHKTTTEPDAAHHKPHKTTPQVVSHKAPPPVVLPAMPSGPLSQMPMDQIPPTPAKVTFQGGLLTIAAQNSTLGEILRDVRKLIGASIEFPPGSNGANEHVVTHLGPGSPRDVMVALLNGSSFNYVMLGSNADPTAVASVILTPKESEAAQPQTQTQAVANVYQNAPAGMPPNRFPGAHVFNPQAQPGTAVAAQADDSKDDDQDTAEDNADEQTQPGQPVQPDTAAAEQQPADANQPNAGPKTPEQILEMLRKTQQPQPGGAVTNPPPPQPQQQ